MPERMFPATSSPLPVGVLTRSGRAGPGQQARDAKGRQQLPDPGLRRGGVGFENFFVHGPSPPYVRRLRSAWLTPSMIMTVDKQHDQDHAQAVIFAPADLFIHNETQAARADIAEDRRIAHVALQAEQRHGQIRRQHLRKNRGDERAQPRRAERFQRLIRPHIHGLDDLKQLLADIGKRKDRDGAGTGHGAETENIRRDQRADQRRQRPHQTQKQAHEKHHHAVRHDIAGRRDGKRNGQHRADKRAQERHLDRIPQRLPDLAQIRGVGREHRLENVEEFAALLHQHREVEARDRGRTTAVSSTRIRITSGARLRFSSTTVPSESV